LIDNTEYRNKGAQRPIKNIALSLHEPYTLYTIMTRNKIAMTHTEEYWTMNMKIITNTLFYVAFDYVAVAIHL